NQSYTEFSINFIGKMDALQGVALVTGGVQGIGLGIVKQLLGNGIKGVSICDIKEKEGEAIVQQLQHKHGKDKVIFIKTDVSQEEQMRDAFKNTLQHFGSLDIVVNNAGICDEQQWRRAVAVNLNGSIQGNLLALDFMGKDQGGKGGVVVNVASTTGMGIAPFLPTYSATKHGIIGFTKSLSTEFVWETTGVRVMAVCPGFTETDLATKDGKCCLNTYRKEWLPQLTKVLEQMEQQQKADCVGVAVVRMLREGKTGSIWIAEDEEVYELNIPHYKQMRI
ncbi:hypothetical protein L9F63_015485, partial [Diploptera punctata]